MRTLTIGDREISDTTDAYVIAEIGHNHEGDLATAEKLVRAAARAGATAAKLQKRDNRNLYVPSMYDMPYPGVNSYGATYGEHRTALELGLEEYTHLAKVAAAVGIDFIATAFDAASVDFLAQVGVPAIKIASADLTNTPLLAYAAKVGVPLIVSTGAADLADVVRAVETIVPINANLALLQCTAIYPAVPAELHLAVITTLRETFPDLVIGFSGHDTGTAASTIAYALGARVVEKHFTLDRRGPGSDQHFSLEPPDLERLVRDLRVTRESLGTGEKRRLPAELPALHKMGKKLVAARDLPAGHLLTGADIAIKSPGDGLPPYLLGDLVGRRVRAPMAADESFRSDSTR
ncbi:N-acetylneuraminate synthase [Micromonospora rosaria]|uniref:N-acetylneuraminate synthase n=1 Tax=Micromonospora rosaria TaxID=47874 RepID=A0A136PTW8_9ACTN|nr:N-acetylneuraminate synthase family protein [Micromonospora rosaria]KXK61853.1 N-acetylneuraminate synthase [Micromonospora rosaria]